MTCREAREGKSATVQGPRKRNNCGVYRYQWHPRTLFFRPQRARRWTLGRLKQDRYHAAERFSLRPVLHENGVLVFSRRACMHACVYIASAFSRCAAPRGPIEQATAARFYTCYLQ